MKPVNLRTVLVLALALTSCGGLRGTVISEPRNYPGFPSHSNDPQIWAEATFYTNHTEIFGTDLLRHGYLPIALRIGIKERDGVTRRLADDGFDPHLYLEDGTPLGGVGYDRVEHGQRRVLLRVAELALERTVLGEWGQSREGFVFFRFDGDVIKIDETDVKLQSGDLVLELDLLQSLVAFTVRTPDGDRVVRVGLRGGRYTER